MSRSAALAMQPSLPGFCAVTDAVVALSDSSREERGAVFTRREVVDFMLDLVGYESNLPLHQRRLLEPSFGDGDFLFAAVERLLASYEITDSEKAARDLRNAICAVELHRESYAFVRVKLLSLLCSSGLALPHASALIDAWLVQGDFLLTEFSRGFDFVVGNPPYIRQEMIPAPLIDEYRRRFETIFDRADIYVPFIEHGLRLLGDGGSLSFICSDRWMKNRYGGPLRRMIATTFHFKTYVDMVGTDAFRSDVTAYPAIFVIGRDGEHETRIAHRPPIERDALTALARALNGVSSSKTEVLSHRVVGNTDEPWVLDDFEALSLVRRLESEHPTLEEAGCKVGIGVATGADAAFIGKFDELDVEDERKLPLVMTRDIGSGEVDWRGLGVINPFLDDGRLAAFADFPRFARYLEQRRDQIAGRHIAQKTPANWYRTIDRIYPALTSKPKLLIPDIKGEAHIVYEQGRLYPHHNLYFITSDIWDLEALRAVLRSGIGRLFVSTYSTKMRGGFLRFQAQYLRRIRVPTWTSVAPRLREILVTAGRRGDDSECNEAVAELYHLSDAELDVLTGGKVSR